jgi:hypothetical protein
MPMPFLAKPAFSGRPCEFRGRCKLVLFQIIIQRNRAVEGNILKNPVDGIIKKDILDVVLQAAK